MKFLKFVQPGMRGVFNIPNHPFRFLPQQALPRHANVVKHFSLFSTSDISNEKENGIKDNESSGYTFQHDMQERSNIIRKSRLTGLIITIDVEAARFIDMYSGDGNFLNYYGYSESLEELVSKGIVKARMIEPLEKIHEQYILDPEKISYNLQKMLVIEGQGHQFEYIYNFEREEEIITSNIHFGVFASIDRNAAYELGSVLQHLESKYPGKNQTISRYYSGVFSEAINDGTIRGHNLQELDDVICFRDLVDCNTIPYYYKRMIFSEIWKDMLMQPVIAAGINFFPSCRQGGKCQQNEEEEIFLSNVKK